MSYLERWGKRATSMIWLGWVFSRACKRVLTLCCFTRISCTALLLDMGHDDCVCLLSLELTGRGLELIERAEYRAIARLPLALRFLLLLGRFEVDVAGCTISESDRTGLIVGAGERRL